MAYEQVDRLVRTMTDRVSRRSVLRRTVGSAMTGPLGLFGLNAALADGKDKNKNKDKGKGKDKGNQGGPGNSACRDVGHPCEGNQVCCPGLVCGTDGPGNAMRCGLGAGVSTEQTSANQTVINTNTTNQTVVQTNNQVCAGDCTQTNVQSAGVTTTQTVLVENQDFFARPPTYWVDVACAFDAPRYRTVCDCVALSEPGAPPVRKITLTAADICAFLISEEMRPVTLTTGDVTNTTIAGPSEANAGTGGVANADASGGTVTIGDVRSDDTTIAIDASGGNASADASGGDNNIAIAGSQVSSEAAQTTELSALTLTLEGNVVPGKLTTYWVDTDAGRRPATGPALVQVADEDESVGALIAEARLCNIIEPQQGYDWFGQCTTPAIDMPFSLYPAGSDAGPLATQTTNAQGRAHFGGLTPGTYHLQPDGMSWCYAESDLVDADGNVIVEAGLESHVWSFVCGRGS